MKQKTAPHAMMKAISTFLEGFRHISLCGSRTDSSAQNSTGKPRNTLAATHQFSRVMKGNVHLLFCNRKRAGRAGKSK
jgi:hypothetical protein